MKLIALCSIMAASGLVRPGGPLEVGDDEGENLQARRFARQPTDAEFAQHWPEEAAAQKAVAEAQAQAEADAAAKAPADAAAAEAKPAAKTKAK